MTAFIQIILCYLAVQTLDIVSCKPFAEVGFKRNFEFLLKPIPFKPIEFFKEKWSPFGKFGTKHAIGKRDLDKIKTINEVPPVPVAVGTGRLTRLPAAVYETDQERTPVPVRLPNGRVPIQVTSLAPIFLGPIPASPLPPVLLVTPPARPAKVNEGAPYTGLYTDIARNEIINDYIKSFERRPPIKPEEKVLPPLITNSLIPEKPKTDVPPVDKDKEESNPILRGSRMALYFGNILLEVLTQFLGGPRSSDVKQ